MGKLVIHNAQIEMPPEWVESLLKALEPRMREIAREEAANNQTEVDEDFKFMEWFLQKYKMSKQTFNEIRREGNVYGFKKGSKFFRYSVAQFKRAYDKHHKPSPFKIRKFIQKVG